MNSSSDEPQDSRAWTQGLGPADRHRLLADERRRETMALLAKRDTPVALDELAAAVAAREADTASPEPDLVEQVAISLHHVHLPMLDEMDLITYDPTSNRVDAVRA